MMGYISTLIVLGIVTPAYYLIIIFTPINITLLIQKTRIIYTKYGTYFLYTKYSEQEIRCDIYENKYWIYLTKVPINDITYSGDLDEFILSLEDELGKYHGRISEVGLEKKRLYKALDKWDGSTNRVTRRDKIIDDIL